MLPFRRVVATLVVQVCFITAIFPQTRDLRVEKDAAGKDRSLTGPKVTPAITAWPAASKRWAIIIGVDKYDDKQITPLFAASNDASALAEAFIANAGFPRDQVMLLASGQPTERHPNRANILLRLANFAKLVPQDGLLLFAFAGHGIERNGEAFLLPADARMTDNIRVLQSTALSVSELKEWIQEMGVKQVLVLLDACRNDPMAGRSGSPNLMSNAYRKGFDFETRNSAVEAFATLYATRVGQRAYEYSEKKHGYFTWAIVEGLKGRAANPQGEVTLGSLEKFIQETVPRQIGIDLGADKDQRPFADVRGYKASELVIAKVDPLQAHAAEQGPPPPDPRLMQLEAWEKVRSSRDVGAVRAYLDKFPNGAFAQDATRRIEEIEWEAAKTAGDVNAYRAFLSNYPNGFFGEQARLAVQQIEHREATQLTVSEVLRLYQEAYRGRDAERLKAVWPTLGKRDLARVEEFFKMARSVDLQLEPIAPPQISGDVAVVNCRRTLQFSDERGERPPVQDAIVVRLRHSDGSWAIDSVK